MLESYRVVKEKSEDVLYLYLTFGYEFSEELDSYELENKANDWLCKERIQFQGDKVVVVVDGIVSKVLHLKKEHHYDDQKTKVTMTNHENLSIYDLLLSLLFTNIKMTLPLEALKALVVLYRSEIIHHMEEKEKIPLTCQYFTYTNHNYYKLLYPTTYHTYFDLFQKAIEETKNEYLTYQEKAIDCYYHIASNGYTEEKEGVPYLVRKESFWDLAYPHYLQQRHFTIEQLKEQLRLKEGKAYLVQILNVSEGNRIKSLRIGNQTFSDKDLITQLGLPSSDATILIEKDGLTFITRGVGSGYGLSLVGASALANLDCNYRQILGYYFKDVILNVKEK